MSDSKLKIVIISLGRDFTGDIEDKPYQVVFRSGFMLNLSKRY